MVAKPSFDTVVMEDGEADGCFPDSTDANESNGVEVFSETDDPVDQIITSEAGSWCRGRRLSKDTRRMYKTLVPLIITGADLV